jgi:hypothetical protein
LVALGVGSEVGRWHREKARTHDTELELEADEDVFSVVDAQCVKELLFATMLSLVIVSRVKILKAG